MYKNILIPTDGSELSEKAIKEGVALAKLCGAKVTGFHAYPSYHFHPDAAYVLADVRTRQELSVLARTQADTFLDRMQAAVKAAGLDFERVVVQDDQVWKAIVDSAREKGCDAIVMAAHGRRGLSALVIGSETTKVLTHSTIPVLVCH